MAHYSFQRPGVHCEQKAGAERQAASELVSGRARDGYDSPEVRGDLGFVRAFRPRLIDMMKGLKACWIATRCPERSPNPHQISGEELNLLAFAKTNRDHLIGNPVWRVQYISGFGQ